MKQMNTLENQGSLRQAAQYGIKVPVQETKEETQKWKEETPEQVQENIQRPNSIKKNKKKKVVRKIHRYIEDDEFTSYSTNYETDEEEKRGHQAEDNEQGDEEEQEEDQEEDDEEEQQNENELPLIYEEAGIKQQYAATEIIKHFVPYNDEQTAPFIPPIKIDRKATIKQNIENDEKEWTPPPPIEQKREYHQWQQAITARYHHIRQMRVAMAGKIKDTKTMKKELGLSPTIFEKCKNMLPRTYVRKKAQEYEDIEQLPEQERGTEQLMERMYGIRDNRTKYQQSTITYALEREHKLRQYNPVIYQWPEDPRPIKLLFKKRKDGTFTIKPDITRKRFYNFCRQLLLQWIYGNTKYKPIKKILTQRFIELSPVAMSTIIINTKEFNEWLAEQEVDIFYDGNEKERAKTMKKEIRKAQEMGRSFGPAPKQLIIEIRDEINNTQALKEVGIWYMPEREMRPRGGIQYRRQTNIRERYAPRPQKYKDYRQESEDSYNEERYLDKQQLQQNRRFRNESIKYSTKEGTEEESIKYMTQNEPSETDKYFTKEQQERLKQRGTNAETNEEQIIWERNNITDKKLIIQVAKETVQKKQQRRLMIEQLRQMTYFRATYKILTQGNLQAQIRLQQGIDEAYKYMHFLQRETKINDIDY